MVIWAEVFVLTHSFRMFVLVAVSTDCPRLRIEFFQLHRISKPAVYFCPRGEYHYFQQDDDQLAGQGIHSVAHHLGDLNYRVLLHFVVADQVVQVCCQYCSAGRVPAIR